MMTERSFDRFTSVISVAFVRMQRESELVVYGDNLLETSINRGGCEVNDLESDVTIKSY